MRLDAVESGLQCVRTHWIWGFMAFKLVRRIQAVMLMVPMWPESGFLGRAVRPRDHKLHGILLEQHERGFHVV